MKTFRYHGTMHGARNVAVSQPENIFRLDMFTAGKYSHSVFYYVEPRR